jgi:putative flippase GtrA
MLGRVGQVVAWSKTHQGKKLIRFTSVSVISTVVSQGLIVIFYGITKWMGVVEATVVANSLATIPAYNLNRRWTWGKRGRSHLMREVAPFWMMSALGIAFSFFGSLFARHIVNSHHWNHTLIGTLIVMAANFFSFAIFWVLKLIVFNRIFHVPSELDEVEEHLVHEEEVEHVGGRATDGEGVSP